MFHASRTFSPEDRQRLRDYADLAAAHLRDVSLHERYEAVARVGYEVNHGPETVEALINKLHEGLASIIDADYCVLGIYQRDSLDLHVIDHDQYRKYEDQPLAGISRHVMQTQVVFREGKLTRLTDAPFTYRQVPDSTPGIPDSVIFVPLTLRGLPLGVLSVQQMQTEAYDTQDIHILQLLANHITLALNNMTLLNSLRSLTTVGQRLTQLLESEQLLEFVVGVIRQSTQADYVSLFPYIQEKGGFERPPRASGDLIVPDFERPSGAEIDDLAELVLRHPNPIFAQDSSSLKDLLGMAEEDSGPDFVRRERITSTVALPLRVGDESIGVLFVSFRRPRRFDVAQRELIQGLASYAAVAIQNSRAFGKLAQRRIREFEAIQRINQAVSRHRDVPGVLQSILEQTVKEVPAKEGAIYIHDRRRNALVARAAVGNNRSRRLDQAVPLDEERGIIRSVFRTKASVRVEDVKSDRDWSPIYIDTVESTRSELDVPLLFEGQVIGVINMESPEPDAFSREDEIFLNTLAGNVIHAIVSARYNQRLEGMRSVDRRIILQLDDPRHVIRTILEQAIRQSVAERAALYRYEDGAATARVYYAMVEQSRGEAEILVEFPEEPSIGGEEPAIVSRVRSQRSGERSFDGREVAAPLLTDEIVLGVVWLWSSREGAFIVEDLDLLADLASQAVIAVQSARYYAQSLVERQRFERLYEVAAELALLTDMGERNDACNIVVRKAQQQFKGKVAVYQYDEEAERLVVACSSGAEAAREYVWSVIDVERSAALGLPMTTTVVHDVATASVPATIRQVLDLATGSFVCVPIHFETRSYGYVMLTHTTPGHYRDSDIELVQGLIRELGLTLKRLEAVEEGREAERRFRELEAVSSAGQGALELAHRIGNRLGLVKSLIKNVRRATGPLAAPGTEADRNLNKIVTAVSYILDMSTLLKNQLVTQRAMMGQERRDVSLRALVDQVTLALSPLAPGIDLQIAIPDGLSSIHVVADTVIVIVQNLMINAIDVMPHGGIISLRARVVGRFVELDVTDTGPGIADEHLKKIFNLWWSTKGTFGIGLWSAQTYALQNGGRLSVRSRLGHGTTFTLTLPASTDQDRSRE
jgi:GAF domain-containing protein